MSNNILFIFEGERAEGQILSSLQNYFLNEKTVIKCIFGAEIYQIYKKIVEDEDLDTFSLLKERNYDGSSVLEGYSRNDFAELYMFFDYDGHSSLANDDTLIKLVEFFDEETDKGKLYVSYPMVESLKHICSYETFRDLKVECKKNIKYKNYVSETAMKELSTYSKYEWNTWRQLIDAHLCKMNYIVNDFYFFPESLINQIDIFAKQLLRYIGVDATVAVLSAFPVFIHDYYGNAEIKKRMDQASF